MKMTKIRIKFDQLEQQIRPKPKLLRNCIMAFIVGGLICVIGQFVRNNFILWLHRRTS